jgi:hypothetical protein
MTHPLSRDPRTIASSDPTPELPRGAGHPDWGRDADLFVRLIPALRAELDRDKDESGLSLSDLVGHILAVHYWGPLATPEQLAAEQTLTPEEAYVHLDPELKTPEDKAQVINHLASLPEPLTIDVLEREEDKAVERLYIQRLDEAQERATIYEGDHLQGRRKKGISQARYAAEVELVRQTKQRDDRTRARRREQRRALLCAAAVLIAPQLRREGDPRLQRQYEQPSHWATLGGYTRRDVAEASGRAPKDTS